MIANPIGPRKNKTRHISFEKKRASEEKRRRREVLFGERGEKAREARDHEKRKGQLTLEKKEAFTYVVSETHGPKKKKKPQKKTHPTKVRVSAASDWGKKKQCAPSYR